MSKVAQTENPVHDMIRGRWSPRAFSDQMIGDADLATVIEAAGWAASAFNAQPWRYVYAHRGTAEFDAILSSLVEFNQGWAKHAAVIMVICAEVVNAEGKENRHAWYDTGAASATLILQAQSMGIYAHQMAGFNPQKAEEVTNAPEGMQAIACMALGYIGDPDSLPDGLKERELGARTRKPISEIGIAGSF